MLYEKLYDLEISGKILRIIIKLYDSDNYVLIKHLEIPTSMESSKPICSPSLFCVCVSALKEYFLEWKLEVVNTGSSKHLAYII